MISATRVLADASQLKPAVLSELTAPTHWIGTRTIQLGSPMGAKNGVMNMMVVPRLMVAAVICALPGTGLAQNGVAAVESVVSAAPQADGQAYVLSLKLQDGRQISLQIPPTEAVKIVDGLSKVAGSGSEKRQVVALVQGMSIQADPQGKFVLLQPRTSAGPLEALAIPLEGAERFVQLFQQRAADTRANAARTQQHN